MNRPFGKPATVSDERIFTAAAKTVQFVNPKGMVNYAAIRPYGREGIVGRGDRDERTKHNSVADEMAKQGRPLK